MKDPRSTGDVGFTLVELMIVVVILGVLAAIAIPLFVRYVKQTKTVEARENLGHIYQGSLIYYSENRYNAAEDKYYSRVFPDSSAAINPSPVPKGQKVTASWEAQPWNDLSFEPVGMVYFSYNYVSTGSDVSGEGASFTAQALGDLDGDGTTGLLQRSAVVIGGEIVGSALKEVNPLE